MKIPKKIMEDGELESRTKVLVFGIRQAVESASKYKGTLQIKDDSWMYLQSVKISEELTRRSIDCKTP